MKGKVNNEKERNNKKIILYWERERERERERNLASPDMATTAKFSIPPKGLFKLDLQFFGPEEGSSDFSGWDEADFTEKLAKLPEPEQMKMLLGAGMYLSSQNVKLNQEINELKEKFALNEAKLASIEEEANKKISSSTNQLNQDEREIDRLEAAIKALNDNAEKKDKVIKDLQKETNDFRNELAAKNELLTNEKKEISRLKKELEGKAAPEEQIAKLKKELTENKNDFDTLFKTNADENEAWKRKKDAYEKEATAFNQIYDQLTFAVRELEDKCQYQERELKILRGGDIIITDAETDNEKGKGKVKKKKYTKGEIKQIIDLNENQRIRIEELEKAAISRRSSLNSLSRVSSLSKEEGQNLADILNGVHAKPVASSPIEGKFSLFSADGRKKSPQKRRPTPNRLSTA